MRSALPLAAFVALLVGISVVLAGAASTIALERGRGGSLDTDLPSLIRADYSAAARSQKFAPLNTGVIEVAQQDNQLVPATGEDIEFVLIFRLNPPAAGPDSTGGGGPLPPRFEEGPTSTPTPTPTPKPTPTFGPTLPPTPIPTPKPTPTAAPTPTPTQPPPPCFAPDPLMGFVQSVTPSDGALGVSVSTNVVIKFNQPMNAATIHTNNVHLPPDTGNRGAVNLSYNATTHEATLNPVADLDGGAEYYPSIWKQIENACGTRQGVEVRTMFTTAP